MASRGRLDFADVVIAAKMVEEQADVAQLVEQLIRNQQVNGSSPFVGSIEFSLRVGEVQGWSEESLMGACQKVALPSVGSRTVTWQV